LIAKLHSKFKLDPEVYRRITSAWRQEEKPPKKLAKAK
jgi:hypothetical protein